MNIHYLQVWSEDLNISKALNNSIDILPNGWICLTDQDTLKFPSFHERLVQIINANNPDCLIGPKVNRLRPSNPQVINSAFNDPDINNHFNLSDELWNEHHTTTIETNLIAGSCMVFHKSLWTKVGGFDESQLFFDKYFSYAVAESGGKCLIANGLYIFHLYRWGKSDPVSSVGHLIKKAGRK